MFPAQNMPELILVLDGTPALKRGKLLIIKQRSNICGNKYKVDCDKGS